MAFPNVGELRSLLHQIESHSLHKHDRGAEPAEALRSAETALRSALQTITAQPDDPALTRREPDDLQAIRALRPDGPRRLAYRFDRADYQRKLEGALLARMAACTLGAIVEAWTIERMEAWAKTIGDAFPPVDYWSAAWQPRRVRYLKSEEQAYTRAGMSGVPVDDDIAYTLLGLLILERCGRDFTTADVATMWLKHVPMAYTAEEVTLANLKRGIAAKDAGAVNNPYQDWIGADIRADPWGYACPGRPELAAELAWRDAILSHRRGGVYGAMLFAAAVAAAFAVNDPLEAVRMGLTEIPRDCRLAHDVQWALDLAPTLSDYRAARAAVDQRFPGMPIAHTNNNACLTIFGLAIGNRDVTRTMSQTVAMGLDNDCTAATAGSILGAIVGRDAVPHHWTRPFNNTIHSYLTGEPRFDIDDVVRRFARVAEPRE